jgi:hypothetical protein
MNGLAVALEQARPVQRRVEIEERAGHRRDEHDEDRQEQLVAVALARGGAFGIVRGRRAPPDELERRKRRKAEHEEAVGDVAEPVPGDQAQRDEPPEGGVAEPLRVRPIGEAQERPGGEQRSDQVEDVLDRDHLRAFPSERSSISSLAPWMMKAAIAVGIAQTASSSGERMMS